MRFYVYLRSTTIKYSLNEPHHDKTNKMACAPSKDSDQPGHPPSLIRVFPVRLKKAKILSYPLGAQQRLLSDWAYAQADLSLRLAHIPFCWFCHDAAQMWFSDPFLRHTKSEYHWSCIAYLNAEDMLKPAVIEEMKFKNIEPA